MIASKHTRKMAAERTRAHIQQLSGGHRPPTPGSAEHSVFTKRYVMDEVRRLSTIQMAGGEQ